MAFSSEIFNALFPKLDAQHHGLYKTVKHGGAGKDLSFAQDTPFISRCVQIKKEKKLLTFQGLVYRIYFHAFE